MQATPTPDLTVFSKVKTLTDAQDFQVNELLEGGWQIISVGQHRVTDEYEGGDFRDRFVVLLGMRTIG